MFAAASRHADTRRVASVAALEPPERRGGHGRAPRRGDRHRRSHAGTGWRRRPERGSARAGTATRINRYEPASRVGWWLQSDPSRFLRAGILRIPAPHSLKEEFDEKMKRMLAACEVDSSLARPTASCKSGVMVWDYCDLYVGGCNPIAEVGSISPKGPIGPKGPYFCVQGERCNLHCKES